MYLRGSICTTLQLLPFSIEELRGHVPNLPADVDTYLFRGMYPRVWDQGLDPVIAYGAYVETYLERDLRQLSPIKDLALFQRFLALCAGRLRHFFTLSDTLQYF